MPKQAIQRTGQPLESTSSINKKKMKKIQRMTTAHYVRRSKRIGSMSNAPPGQKTITAARQFFDIPEMLDHLAGTLQWPELTNLANTSFYASKVVGRIIRGRIRSKSAPFFSKPEDMEALFEVLRRAHASITGSLAWYIMTAEDVQHTSVPLMDLNIIAPRGIENVLPCIDFFRNLGYKHIWCKTSSDPYKDVASRIISLQRRKYAVTITESKTDSVLPIVVASPLTSMMNIISPYRIYCMYPSLLRDRTTVRGVHSVPDTTMHRLKLRGIHVQWSTSAHREPCGQICPALWRRTEGLTGVACTVWNPFADTKFIPDPPSKEEELGYANFKWRLGFVCRNRRCPNSSPAITASSVTHDRLR